MSETRLPDSSAPQTEIFHPIQRVERRGLLSAGIFRIVLDEVRLPSGQTEDYAFVKRGDTVVVIPQDRTGKIGVFKQYTYPTRSWFWKFPGGGCDGRLPDTVVVDPRSSESDQKQAQANNRLVEDLVKPHAARELQQEAGLVADQLIYVGNYLPDPSNGPERCHILVAQSLTSTATELDSMEFVTSLSWFSQKEILDMILLGELKHGKLIAPFFLALYGGSLSRIGAS